VAGVGDSQLAGENRNNKPLTTPGNAADYMTNY